VSSRTRDPSADRQPVSPPEGRWFDGGRLGTFFAPWPLGLLRWRLALLLDFSVMPRPLGYGLFVLAGPVNARYLPACPVRPIWLALIDFPHIFFLHPVGFTYGGFYLFSLAVCGLILRGFSPLALFFLYVCKLACFLATWDRQPRDTWCRRSEVGFVVAVLCCDFQGPPGRRPWRGYGLFC